MLALVPSDDAGRAKDGLAAVRAFAVGLARGSWFAACGEPLTNGEIADVDDYLAALGMNDIAVARADDWREAAAVVQRPDWSRAWWEGEAQAQSLIKRRLVDRFGEAPVLAALSTVTEAADRLHGAAALATSRAGIADPALNRVAAGAAAQSCYQAALALAADAGPEHLFAAKFRLFAAGRWPLAIVGGDFFVF